jgi:hypothetical protein
MPLPDLYESTGSLTYTKIEENADYSILLDRKTPLSESEEVSNRPKSHGTLLARKIARY